MIQWVKDLALSPQKLGHCCGTGYILGPGTYTTFLAEGWPKKKRKRKNEKKNKINTVYFI